MGIFCLYFSIIVILGFTSSTIDGFEYEKLENNGIFTFQNRHDGGFLTAINVRTPYPPIVTDKWREIPTQKWRAEKAYFSTVYRFKPISDEHRVMHLDHHKRILNQDTEGFGLSNNQYWRIKYVGQGFAEIISHKTGECLKTAGPGKQVGVSRCTGSRRQQWSIRKI